MVRAAQLRNLLEASLKVRGMCAREDSVNCEATRGFQVHTGVHWETWWWVSHTKQECGLCNVIFICLFFFFQFKNLNKTFLRPCLSSPLFLCGGALAFPEERIGLRGTGVGLC